MMGWVFSYEYSVIQRVIQIKTKKIIIVGWTNLRIHNSVVLPFNFFSCHSILLLTVSSA